MLLLKHYYYCRSMVASKLVMDRNLREGVEGDCWYYTRYFHSSSTCVDSCSFSPPHYFVASLLHSTSHNHQDSVVVNVQFDCLRQYRPRWCNEHLHVLVASWRSLSFLFLFVSHTHSGRKESGLKDGRNQGLIYILCVLLSD